jgi:hypothetical protein
MGGLRTTWKSAKNGPPVNALGSNFYPLQNKHFNFFSSSPTQRPFPGQLGDWADSKSAWSRLVGCSAQRSGAICAQTQICLTSTSSGAQCSRSDDLRFLPATTTATCNHQIPNPNLRARHPRPFLRTSKHTATTADAVPCLVAANTPTEHSLDHSAQPCRSVGPAGNRLPPTLVASLHFHFETETTA